MLLDVNGLSNAYGNTINRKFCDIFPDIETFKTEYEDSGLFIETNKITNIDILYLLLYAKYGNSTIKSYDENQFKYKVFSTIFMYGPTWEKRLDIQSKIRSLSEDDITLGSKRINNISYNPSDPPNNDSMTPLTTINQQVFDGWKKSPLEGYSNLMAIVDTDVTEEFLGKFKKLFRKVVLPDTTVTFVTYLEGDEQI